MEGSIPWELTFAYWFVQKTAVAVAYVKRGKGEVRLNGAPIELIQPDTLRWKIMEPILLLGKQRFSNVDIRLRVKGGGRVSQSYALRQAIAKGLVAFYQKCTCDDVLRSKCPDIHREMEKNGYILQYR